MLVEFNIMDLNGNEIQTLPVEVESILAIDVIVDSKNVDSVTLRME